MENQTKNVLRSWASSLKRYGKVDSWNFSQSISTLSKYLRFQNDRSTFYYLVRQIRDRSVGRTFDAETLLSLIQKALCENEEVNSKDIKVNAKGEKWTKKRGQEIRFRNETEHIFDEKLRFKSGMALRNFDIETESACDSRKVRRIIEKRMCQAYHRMNKRSSEARSNRDRYWEQRATAFQLYNIGQIENISDIPRGYSTHWKKMYDPYTGQVVYKKKMAYNSEKEALEAVERWHIVHPWDRKEIHAYQCCICHKWHIGHYNPVKTENEEEVINVAC